MRIRTIKPEFWSNEALARLSDKGRLLAIGLLNYADDDGYFWAHPALIKSAVFPFDDDSSIIRRLLDDLSNAGYLRLGTSVEERAVGQVLNFRKHQRIDRPKPSQIKELAIFDDDSTNDRRTIDAGTGNREQGTGNNNTHITHAGEEEIFEEPETEKDNDNRGEKFLKFLDRFRSEEFDKLFTYWLDHFADNFTDTQIELKIQTLIGMRDPSMALKSLKQSTANGWHYFQEPFETRAKGGASERDKYIGNSGAGIEHQQHQRADLPY